MLKIIRDIIKNEGILRIFNKCLLQILGLFLKKNETIWVFGEGYCKRFLNNSKHFLLFVFKNYKNIHPIWLTKKKEIINQIRELGQEAYKINSSKALYYSLIAKVYIHSYGHLNSFSENNITKLIVNDFKHSETNYFGHLNKNYNKFLLKIRQIIDCLFYL
ncbi:MAG: hypothetical protein KAU01_10290 [Candidatus Cloacimonetes bacterium]|nr:hypothetical protein [Candidatus Cloacimonadota bacterium]